MRHQDTLRTRIEVMEPLLRNVCVWGTNPQFSPLVATHLWLAEYRLSDTVQFCQTTGAVVLAAVARLVFLFEQVLR